MEALAASGRSGLATLGACLLLQGHSCGGQRGQQFVLAVASMILSFPARPEVKNRGLQILEQIVRARR